MNTGKQRAKNTLRLLTSGVLSTGLCIGLFWILRDREGEKSPDSSNADSSSAGSGGNSIHPSSRQTSDADDSAHDSVAAAQGAASSDKKPDEEGPSVTRARSRDGLASSSAGRKTLVDPMASWDSPPPWPEGPRLYAEVETATRTYINLRPDDVGELPRIHAAAQERIELRIHFPEGSPGEKIFIEIPNGGSFPDHKDFGKVYPLPENRTISFPYITDDSRGYCTVALRHRGHTRSLPIWVGELPEPFPSDS